MLNLDQLTRVAQGALASMRDTKIEQGGESIEDVRSAIQSNCQLLSRMDEERLRRMADRYLVHKVPPQMPIERVCSILGCRFAKDGLCLTMTDTGPSSARSSTYKITNRLWVGRKGALTFVMERVDASRETEEEKESDGEEDSDDDEILDVTEAYQASEALREQRERLDLWKQMTAQEERARDTYFELDFDTIPAEKQLMRPSTRATRRPRTRRIPGIARTGERRSVGRILYRCGRANRGRRTEPCSTRAH